MNAETREAVAARGISVWLKADADTIIRRARRRSNRPLLQTSDPEKTVRELMANRYPIYALADVTVESEDGPHENTADAVLAALAAHVGSARHECGKADALHGQGRPRRPVLRHRHRTRRAG